MIRRLFGRSAREEKEASPVERRRRKEPIGMRVLVDKARERETDYYFRLILNPDLPEEEQEIKEFTYGKDMPLAQIRDEIMAILHNDFGSHPEEVLEYEGQEFEI